MWSNPVRAKLKRGEPVIGTMITDWTSPAIALVLADAGFDFFFIDMEHGPYDLDTVSIWFRVARLTPMVPLVRVPDAEYHLIARVLDAGAMGVMVPRVESRATVEMCIAAMRYPPLGDRGCATGRGNNDYVDLPMWEHTRHANDNILAVMQIERKAALEHIDDLLSVPGVDVALVGPNDLALSLGAPRQDDPSVDAAIQCVVDSAARHQVASGIHLRDTELVKAWQARGMTMLTCGTEVGFVKSGAHQVVKALRG